MFITSERIIYAYLPVLFRRMEEYGVRKYDFRDKSFELKEQSTNNCLYRALHGSIGCSRTVDVVRIEWTCFQKYVKGMRRFTFHDSVLYC